MIPKKNFPMELQMDLKAIQMISINRKKYNNKHTKNKIIEKLDIKFDAYFTSQLKRATNSLDIILKVLNLLYIYIINVQNFLMEYHFLTLEFQNIFRP